MQAACRAANGKVPLCMVHVKQEPQHLVLSAFRGVPIWEMAQFRCGELRRPLQHWSGAHEFAPSDLWKSVSRRRPRLRLGTPLHKAQRWCNLCAGVCKIRKRRPSAFALATYDRNAEKGPGFLRRFHLVLLRSPGRIVVAPQPKHRFRELRRALRGVVSALAKAEVEVVPL